MELSEKEVGGLKWMAHLNPRIGFLWDYTRKHGAVLEYARLVSEGYAKFVSSHETREKQGYWILPKGREALEAAIKGCARVKPPSPSDAPAPL